MPKRIRIGEELWEKKHFSPKKTTTTDRRFSIASGVP